MTDTEIISAAFLKNQSDTFLDPLKVWWMGSHVCLLSESGRLMATFRAENALRGIKCWCVKNHYRCPAIVNDKIML